MSGPQLASRLREATHSIHREAERSALMREFLRGNLEPRVYCSLLRNWHALYDALESELDRHAHEPALAPVRFPALYRSAALINDLVDLYGAEWTEIPLAEAMVNYVDRIHQLGIEQPTMLAAHAYVRYMADLSGGQVLVDIVSRAFSFLPPGTGTSFYRFAGDPTALKAQFRAALDQLPVDAIRADDIVMEAKAAFERHVRLFEELAAKMNNSG
jgi:heme oxygenase